MILLAGALILLFFSYLIMISPAELPLNSDRRLWQYQYAHRGLHEKDKSVPENSMAAFDKALAAGYGIELDINLTADGEVAVFHDSNLLRVCGVDKLITQCLTAELAGYRLEKTDEQIPLLKEVLQLVDGQVPLLIELKNTPKWPLLCEKAAAILDDYPGAYCIESFHPGIVRWFCLNRPKVVRGQLSARGSSLEGIPLWQSLPIAAMVTNLACHPHFIAYKHQDARHRIGLGLFRLMGGKLACWTVRDTDDADQLRKQFDVMIFEFFRPGE
jgi:glycerophosphoryl diester phosphodiesterase